MALDFPNREEIIERERVDVKATLPDSNPFEPVSIINALLVAHGGRIREIYDQLLLIQRDTFVTTAVGQALIERGVIYDLFLNPASQAQGFITLTGVASTLVPISSELRSQSGQLYNTITSVTISVNTLNVSTLTRSGTTATVVTVSNHNLASGMEVIIAGAIQIEYNGTFVITVTGLDEFTYDVEGTPVTPATGVITVTFTGASVEVISAGTGQDTNLASGSQISLTQTIAGVDNTGFVQFGGIDGGTDIETFEEFRSRILQRIQNPITPYNKSNIIVTAREVPGVTRVFVFQPDEINTEVTPTDVSTIATDFVKVTFPVEHKLLAGMKIVLTGAVQAPFNTSLDGARVLIVSPTEIVYLAIGASGTATGTLNVQFSNVQLGQTRILFVRDNDASIIPSAQEVSDVKDKILEIKPANTSDFDVIVQAPIAKLIDFDFSDVTPDTVGIRSSIEANLDVLFKSISVNDTITELQYLTTIQNSFDVETGQSVQSFALNAPTGDLTSDFDEILTLNSIVFNV